jgi:homospermidine synthase
MTNIKSFKSFISETHIKEAKKSPEEVQNIGFDKKILVIGYGSVGQAVVPIILKHITKDPSLVTVLEKDDNGKLFRKRHGGSGVKYIKKQILRNNLDATLKKHMEPGGFIIDVSLNIGVQEIMQWCFDNDVFYINTSLERWETQPDETIPNLADRTLFQTHQRIREFAAPYAEKRTVLSVSGANPGLVNHLTKEALLMIAEKTGVQVSKPTDREGWAQLMKSLGVEVVQIAERDSQIVNVPKEVNVFNNSWSPEGFIAEGRAPSELGWGTVEPEDQEDVVVQGTGAYLTRPGVTVLVKSWAPKFGPYNGYLIQHSEAVTMSRYFETEDQSFRPTVYYAYQPTDAALASVHEFRGRELDMEFKKKVIKDEIVDGVDELGILLITNTGKSYWYGSQLDIHTARKMIPGENATSLQVVANIYGTMMWGIHNPYKGYVEPEDMDYEFILKYAKPYLGKMVFIETDWHPTEDMNEIFHREIDEKNPNCLSNFRVWN